MPKKEGTSPRDAVKQIKESQAALVGLKFTDLLGRWHQITLPAARVDESLFEQGVGFDGSSLPGWQPIHASDMLMRPDPTTLCRDPFARESTLCLLCDILDPAALTAYTRDPRHIAKKAERYLQETGIADAALIGPEAEFFIFDEVRHDVQPHTAFFAIDSREAAWNTGRDERPNLGYKPGVMGGYLATRPHDHLGDVRDEIALTLERLGVEVEAHHHEVGSAGQAEVDLRADSLVEVADRLQWLRHVVKNVARRHHKTATFMPKPIHGEQGNGLHLHISLWRDEEPLFAGDQYAGLSRTALHFIAGVLQHAPALAAITNPTTNSYRRLVPGYEAPIRLAYSARNRSAAIRIPALSPSPRARRVELRSPDPSANGYLAMSAVLMAGIDGIRRELDPGKALDRNLYTLSPEQLAAAPTLPGSLDEALIALERDFEFLIQGDVFTEDVLETWIEHKRRHEIAPTREHPTPLEYGMYFDV